MKEDVLPEGWELKKLGDLVFSIVGGGTPSKKNPSFYKGDIPWITVKDLIKEQLTESVDHISLDAVTESSTRIIPAGTPIIAVRMSLGKIATAQFDTAINQDLKAIFLNEHINKDYFIYWYRSIINIIHELSSGTTVKGIRLENLKSLNVPLPPLPEQQYLSQKLTALLDEVAQTKQRLEAIPALLKQFRQSVLADAVSGRLTEEWREENEKIFEYISGTVADLGIIITGNTPSKKNPENYINGFFPMFKPTDLDSGYYLNNGSDFLTDIGKKLARFIPKHSTLVTCIGATIGKTAFSRINGTCNQQINAIIPNSLFNNKWIYFLMISPEMQNLIIKSSSSTTLPILNKSKFSALPIIYPSKEEQTQIVQKIETYFALADEIETQVKAALENVNLLTQSILAKAFSGELSAAWRKENSQLIQIRNNNE